MTAQADSSRQEWEEVEERLAGRYEIIRDLGGGGQSRVYCARFRSTGKLYAIKHVSEGSIADMDENLRILSRMDHPQIPRTYHVLCNGSEAYLVQEFFPGKSLRKILADNQRMHTRVSTDTAVQWMLSACEPLEYIHSLRPAILHCDIKPGNLTYRSSDHRICLMDFDISREMTDGPVRARALTRGYASPEQKQMVKLDQRADIFSLGAAFFHMTTGQLPDHGWLHWPLRPRFQDILNHCMAPDPASRFQTVEELRNALLKLL